MNFKCAIWSQKAEIKRKRGTYKAFVYLSLFLLITEGRGLKVIPREPPPLVL